MGAIAAELVDTGEKRDGRGRRITPPERQEELLRQYRGSGLTMTAFARRERVNYSTFAGWVAKSGRAGGRRSPVRFAEVRMPLARMPETPQLEVRLSDGTVARGTNASELAALVRALRA